MAQHFWGPAHPHHNKVVGGAPAFSLGPARQGARWPLRALASSRLARSFAFRGRAEGGQKGPGREAAGPIALPRDGEALSPLVIKVLLLLITSIACVDVGGGGGEEAEEEGSPGGQARPRSGRGLRAQGEGSASTVQETCEPIRGGA